jgi:hypothetical protein
VRHLATSESYRRTDLIALAEPLSGVFHSIIVIVIVGARPELDLLDLNRDLLFLRFVSFFLLLVKEFTVIDYLGDGRLRVRSDLDEV